MFPYARSPTSSATTIAAWELEVAPAAGDVAWPAWMPDAWHANASARGFEALATLAGGAGARAAMPRSPELNVQVARC